MSSLRIALISDVFFSADARARLVARLVEARGLGANLAVLPELPLDPWVPANKVPREADAEAPGRRRHAILASAAREAGLVLIGGAIVRDHDTGRRYNTALVFDPSGELVMSYRKLHIPEEEGFWETSHYTHGDLPPRAVDVLGLRLGIQVCSDINRPTLCHALGAGGAELIANPRATEVGTYERWKLVLRANALTSASYVASVNRPPEQNTPLGGPSLLIAPDGEVLVETTAPVAVGTLERDALARAHRTYPGYLPVRSDLYARAWEQSRRPRKS